MRNLIAAIAFFASLGAHASDSALFDVDGVGGTLPSDFTQVTLGASRRAVRAKVVDWEDDLRAIAPKREALCMMTGGWPSEGLRSLPSVRLFHELPAELRGKKGDEAYPLRLPLEFVAKNQPLTDDEAKALQRIADTRVEDPSDELRAMIDSTWLLMRISERAYQAKVSESLGARKLCAAYFFQSERDEVFIESGRRIVAFYYFLERELGD